MCFLHLLKSYHASAPDQPEFANEVTLYHLINFSLLLNNSWEVQTSISLVLKYLSFTELKETTEEEHLDQMLWTSRGARPPNRKQHLQGGVEREAQV